jgi:glucokinase
MPFDRQRIPVENARRPWFVGIDIGGTNIKLGLVDDNGRFLAQTSIPTKEERGPSDAIQRVKASLDTILAELGVDWDVVAGVGLGSPGSQDLRRGWILDPPNLPHWRNFPIRDTVAGICGKPCSYSNDANAAAYGEFWVGTGREHASMVMFTLGTGVGGGILLDGVSVDGEHSFGSELGHIVVDCREDARLCVWGGGRGELEAYASASAVVARTQEALAAGHTSSLTRRIAERGRLSAKMLMEEGEAGDKLSLEIILETARYLGVGVTTVVHTVDPGAIVIGGAMTFGGNGTEVGRRFLAEVRAEFHRRCFQVVAKTTIEYATLGNDAGTIGAAGIARAAWYKRTASRQPEG